MCLRSFHQEWSTCIDECFDVGTLCFCQRSVSMRQSLLPHRHYLEYFHVHFRFRLSFWKNGTVHLCLLTEFSCRTYGTDQLSGLISHRQISINHHFFPQLGDEVSHFIWVLKDFVFQ